MKRQQVQALLPESSPSTERKVTRPALAFLSGRLSEQVLPKIACLETRGVKTTKQITYKFFPKYIDVHLLPS